MPGRGRPTLYTPEIAEEICRRLADGEPLIRICKDDHLPAEATVYGWVMDDREGFSEKYARARQVQAHRMFENTLQIADDGENDTYVDEDGKTRTDYDVIQRSRLRVDTRKWYLSKVVPKLYGDRVAHEHSGPNGGPIETKELGNVTEADIAAQLKKLNERMEGG